MLRLLFVDDEPSVLEALRRMLQSRHEAWDMRFARSGHAALEALAESPADVVISDMHMPGMDGAELSARVREAHPGTVRIVLSGNAELDVAVQPIALVHHYLSKPCDSATLAAAIGRAGALRDLMTRPALAGTLGRIGTLPVAPRVGLQVARLAAGADRPIGDLAGVVGRDPRLASGVLRLANSAYFGRERTAASLADAATRLGAPALAGLVLGTELFDGLSPLVGSPGFDPDRLRRHCAITARIAAALEPRAGWKDQAFVAGLLHDIGKLVFATRMPGPYGEVLARVGADPRADEVTAERAGLGADHAEVGGYLLGRWGLPVAVVEAVARHHAISLPEGPVSPGHAVAIGSRLAHEAVDLSAAGGGGAPYEPSPGWLARAREIAAELRGA